MLQKYKITEIVDVSLQANIVTVTSHWLLEKQVQSLQLETSGFAL